MKQYIVPALPTERIQYERCYQLGLNAVVATEHQLKGVQSQNREAPISWFPQFVVRCQAPHADQRLDEVQQALTELAIQPTNVVATAAWVELTFSFTPSTDTPVWYATAGGLWRLYDGLINNLIQTSVQPIVQIQVGLADFRAADGGAGQVVRPSFDQYSASRSQLTIMASPDAEVGKPVRVFGQLYQLKS